MENITNIKKIHMCKYHWYSDDCRIGDAGACHLSKSKWINL